MKPTFIRVPHSISEDFSVEFSFKTTHNYTGFNKEINGNLIGIYSLGDNSDDWMISIGNNCMQVNIQGIDVEFQDIIFGNYNNGEWHHVLFTRNMNLGRATLYIDNYKVSTSNNVSKNKLLGIDNKSKQPAVISIGAPANWQVKRTGGLTDDGVFKGEIKHVMLYDQELVPSDFLENDGGLVADYRFMSQDTLGVDATGNFSVPDEPYVNGFPNIRGATFVEEGVVKFENGTKANPTYIRVPRSISNDFSVEYGFKTENPHSGSGYACLGNLIGIQSMAHNSDDWTIYMENGKIVLLFQINTGNQDTFYKTPKTYNDGKWHDILLTRNMNLGRATLYIDNEHIKTLDNISKNPLLGIDHNTLPQPAVISIGAFAMYNLLMWGGTSDNAIFKGEIRHVKLYNIEIVP